MNEAAFKKPGIIKYSGLSTGKCIYFLDVPPCGSLLEYETILYLAGHRAVLFIMLKHPWFAFTLAGGGGAKRSLGVTMKGHRQVIKHHP